MSETCIVCLGDLGGSANEPSTRDHQVIKAENSDDEVLDVPFDRSNKTGSLLIAELLPCGHNLHDECLKPWVERANSCPICRQNFNTVVLAHSVGGALSLYDSDEVRR